MAGNQDITANTVFMRQRNAECPDSCDLKSSEPVLVTADNPNFIVHMGTFDLIISKTVANNPNPDQLFVFDVRNAAGKLVAQLTLKAGESETIHDLPVDSYTVEENTEWSWRYAAQQSSIRVTADSVVDGVATAAFTNTPDNDKWLSFDVAVHNAFGKAEQPR